MPRLLNNMDGQAEYQNVISPFHAINDPARKPTWKQVKATALYNNDLTNYNNPFDYFEETAKWDIAMWYGAIQTGPAQQMITNIFATLYYGGLIIRKGGTYSDWASKGMPIAMALSHGYRVMIQLPQGVGNQFWNWLWTGTSYLANTRMAATHGIELQPDPNQQMCFGCIRHMTEGRKDLKNGTHYGVNVALGGLGNRNPTSGRLIKADGEHGHLYLYYVPPAANSYGGILVGCEGSAPIDRRPVFSKQRMFAKDQGGGSHTFGASGKFSPTGGLKWKDQAWHAQNGPTEECNGMIIDLTRPGALNRVMQANFAAKDVGSSGLPPIPSKPLPAIPHGPPPNKPLPPLPGANVGHGPVPNKPLPPIPGANS